MALGKVAALARSTGLAFSLSGLMMGALCAQESALNAQESSLDNVPWADLMVNLPEADMDAYALEYLEQSQHTVTAPTARVVPADTSPSQLAIDEVVLNRQQWLSELNRQADLALANNNWLLAELRLAQALGEFEDAHATRLRLASLLYGRGALGQTRAVLQQGIALAPHYAEFRLVLARLLAEQQRYVAAFEQLSQFDPAIASHLDYYSLKAEVARRSGQCPQAVTTYQQLLSYGSVGAWWLGLGLCQRDLGEEYHYAFQQARASADLGSASQRFVEQQLQQQAKRGQNGKTQAN